VTTARILEQVIEGYQAALRRHADAIDEAPKSIQFVMKQSIARSWKHLANERLENTKPTIPLGSRFWALSKSERATIEELFRTPTLCHLATSLRSRDDDAPVEFTDAAYWMKGCSSLGLLRFAVLLTVGSGKKRDMALMDVKEAVTAAAPRYAKHKMPRDQVERVVEGAMHLSPHLGKRMVAGKIAGKSVFIRVHRRQIAFFRSPLCLGPDVDPGMHVRGSAEVPDHIRTFELPHVPDAVISDVQVFVKRHG